MIYLVFAVTYISLQKHYCEVIPLKSNGQKYNNQHGHTTHVAPYIMEKKNMQTKK